MTDNELMAQAYKVWAPGENYIRLVNDAGRNYWNPLTNDGDALRLAVRLRLNVNIEQSTVDVYDPDMKMTRVWASEFLDANEATRRAIVRAAAAMAATRAVG